MRFEDLKDNMIIEVRSGKKFLIVGERLLTKNTWYSKNDIRGDLKDCAWDEFDVMKVYKSIGAIGLDNIFDDDYIKLIWSREEECFKKDEKVQVSLGCGEWQNAYFVEEVNNNGKFRYGVVFSLDKDDFTGFTDTVRYYDKIRKIK